MNQSERILDILGRIHKGETICTQSDSSAKTRKIQKDLSIIKDKYPNLLEPTSRGCYKKLSTSLDNIMGSNPQEMKKLFEILSVFHPKFFDQITNEMADEYSFIKNIKQESKNIYHMHENPTEELPAPMEWFGNLQRAIKNRQKIDIEYSKPNKQKLLKVHPYKIIFASGNWYLAIFDKNCEINNGFKWLRLSFIKNVTLYKETFHTDIEVEKFIKNFQSLFEYYKEHKYSVILLAKKEIARFFKNKRHLKSQRTIETKEDGSLMLEFTINNEMEIIPLIKKWLPNLIILSPQDIKDKLYEEIKEFFKN